MRSALAVNSGLLKDRVPIPQTVGSTVPHNAERNPGKWSRVDGLLFRRMWLHDSLVEIMRRSTPLNYVVPRYHGTKYEVIHVHYSEATVLNLVMSQLTGSCSLPEPAPLGASLWVRFRDFASNQRCSDILP